MAGRERGAGQDPPSHFTAYFKRWRLFIHRPWRTLPSDGDCKGPTRRIFTWELAIAFNSLSHIYPMSLFYYSSSTSPLSIHDYWRRKWMVTCIIQDWSHLCIWVSFNSFLEWKLSFFRSNMWSPLVINLFSNFVLLAGIIFLYRFLWDSGVCPVNFAVFYLINISLVVVDICIKKK